MDENRSIRLFTVSTCVHCRALREFFTDQKLAFEYVDVDLLQGRERKEILEVVRSFNARCSFPTAVIGSRVVIGFRKEELQEAVDFWLLGR